MSPTNVFPQNNSTSIIDATSAIEYARMTDQDRLFTSETGGLFPEQADPDLPGVKRILDVACGTGSRVLHVASDYPHIHVMGIDVDQDIVRYARTRARAQGLNNTASFRVMDICHPLDFPDHTFDLVNARFIAGVLDPSSWASFVAECMRITVPSGVIRLTEIECWSSTSVPVQRLFALLAEALQTTGHSFSPDGRTFGTAPMLPKLLRVARVQDIHLHPYVLDCSTEASRHYGWCENLRVSFELLRTFLVEVAAVIENDSYEGLLREALIEMWSPAFCAVAFGVTVWGTAPLSQTDILQ